VAAAKVKGSFRNVMVGDLCAKIGALIKDNLVKNVGFWNCKIKLTKVLLKPLMVLAILFFRTPRPHLHLYTSDNSKPSIRGRLVLARMMLTICVFLIESLPSCPDQAHDHTGCGFRDAGGEWYYSVLEWKSCPAWTSQDPMPFHPATLSIDQHDKSFTGSTTRPAREHA
jgi:hypothetical protein